MNITQLTKLNKLRQLQIGFFSILQTITKQEIRNHK